MGDFLAGRTGAYRQANPNPLNVEQNFGGAYVQDAWRIQNVTLNVGVKWNPFFAMSFPAGDIYNFSLDRFYAGTRSTVIPNAPPGFTYPGDGGFAGKSGMNSRLNVFDPRLGFAWDVGGDGRTSVRGRRHRPRLRQVGPASEHVVGVAVPADGAAANVSLETRGRLRLQSVPVYLRFAEPGFAPYGSYLPVPPDAKPTTQYRGISACRGRSRTVCSPRPPTSAAASTT